MTRINDFKNNVVLANDGNSIKPQVATATVNGAGVDLGDAEGNCFAVVQAGTVSGTTPTCDVKAQESADNAAFSDITGATFPQITASNKTAAINFKRTKRYTRLVATIAGTSPSFAISGLIAGQKKAV